jgi:hypothetical protein
MNSYDRLAESIRPDNRSWPFPDPSAAEESVLAVPDVDAGIEAETITAFLSVAENYLNS